MPKRLLQSWFADMPPAPFGLLLTIVLGIHFSGLFNDIFIADSALYAVIAKTMAETNNYLELYVDGRDWLDKPHFPFWVTALSFELLGVNGFAYKLPAFLFTGLALRAPPGGPCWYSLRPYTSSCPTTTCGPSLSSWPGSWPVFTTTAAA